MFARHLFLPLILCTSVALADDVIDRSGTWDVNGPLGESAELTLSIDEGTWMNLDIHPDGESVIFDLLGDLYLMPISGGAAKQLTSGAGYDIQPRFSPDGKRILFTSDRGGIFTIWIADFDSEELSESHVLIEGKANSWGSGSWDDSGEWVFARKRQTDVSSIGISELWMFHRKGGSGVKLVADGAEIESFSASGDGRYLYYGASGPFAYQRDPYTAIWSVNRYDRKTGEKQVVSQGNGSSATPQVSPDGNSIAFLRRVGSKTTLWIHDLATGAEQQIWDGLDRDQIEAFAAHNVYPGYDWTGDNQNIVIWAGGKIWRVPVSKGDATTIPFSIDTVVKYHKPLRSKRNPSEETVSARLIRWPVISPDGRSMAFNALGHLYWMRLPDGEPERVTDMTAFEFAPQFSPDGSSLAFTSWNDKTGGALHTISWRRNGPGNLQTLYRSGTQLVNPAFSADGKQLLVVAGSGASLRGQDLATESRHDILLLDPRRRGEPKVVVSTTNRGPQMRTARPTFSANGQRVYYFDNEGGGGERGSRTPPKTALISIKTDGTDRHIHMQFRYAQEAIVSPDESLVAFTEEHNAYVTALPSNAETVDIDPHDATLAFQRLSEDGGEWVTFSHDGKYLSWSFANKVKRMQVSDIELASKMEDRDAGDDGILVLPVAVGGDGKYAYADNDSYNLEQLKTRLTTDWADAAHVRVDVSIEGESPWANWNSLSEWLTEAKVASKVQEPEKEDEDYGDDEEARAEPEEYKIVLNVPRAKPDGEVAFTGARIITMNGNEVIENGTIVIRENRIVAVGPASDVTVPESARQFDVSGKTIMPGMIDVHAHLGYDVLDINPQKDWQYYANLAYGVTTAHDPSASTHTIFSQSEMISAGIMVGPRIFSTGFILYGAVIPDLAKIDSYADALSHLRRLKSLGAFSVKSYMQPRREQRQWLIRAAAAEGMLVMPEGGGNLPENMGMILDGHSGIEHALPVGSIYQDVIQLFAGTRVGYTPTLLVAYGGQSGENWFYQHYNVWENEKLQSFFPPREIDARARRRSISAEDDYNHKNVSKGANQISAAGGLTMLGAHGQLQGLGAHWELWAMTQGGMSNHNALRTATLNGAEYLGMDAHLGSLEEGKLADLIILDKNPLEIIENSDSVNLTVINGVVYDADSMDQLWPRQVPRGEFHFQ